MDTNLSQLRDPLLRVIGLGLKRLTPISANQNTGLPSSLSQDHVLANQSLTLPSP